MAALFSETLLKGEMDSLSGNSSSAISSDCTNTSIHRSLLGNSFLNSSKWSIENETVLQNCSNISISRIHGDKTFIERVRETLEITGIEKYFPIGALYNVKVKKRKKNTKHHCEVDSGSPSRSDISEQLESSSLLGLESAEESKSSLNQQVDSFGSLNKTSNSSSSEVDSASFTKNGKRQNSSKLDPGKNVAPKRKKVSVTLNSDSSSQSFDKSYLEMNRSKKYSNESYNTQDESGSLQLIGNERRLYRRAQNNTKVLFDISGKGDENSSIDVSTSSNGKDIDLGDNIEFHSAKNPAPSKRVSVQFSLDNSDNENSSRIQSRKSLVRRSTRKSIVIKESPLLEMSERTEDEGKSRSTENIMKEDEIVKGTDHTGSPMNKTSSSEFGQDMDITVTPSPTMSTAETTNRRATREESALNSHETDHIIVTNDNTLGREVDITCANNSLTSNLSDTNESHHFTLRRNTLSNGKDIDLGENMEFHSAKNLAPSKRVSVQFSLDNSDNENSSRIQSRKSMVRRSMRKSIVIKESPLLEISEITQDEGKSSSTENIIKDNEIGKGTDHTESPMNKTSKSEFVQHMDISEAPSLNVLTAEATDRRVTRQVSALNSHEADHIMFTNDNTLGSEVDITCANTSLYSNLSDTNESHNFTLPRNTSSNGKDIDLGDNIEFHSAKNPALSKRVSVQFSLDNSDNENSSRIQSRKSMVSGSMRKSIGLKESPLLEMSETTEDEGKSSSTENIMKGDEIVKGTDHTESPMNKTGKSEFGQDMDISVAPSLHGLIAEATDRCSPREPLLEMSETTEDEGKNNSTQTIIKDNEIVKGTDHTESPMNKISNSEYVQDMDISEAPSPTVLTAQATDRRVTRQVSALNSHEADHIIVTNDNTLGSEVDITCANTSLTSNFTDTNESDNFTLPRNTPSNGKAIDLGENVEIHSVQKPAPSKRVSVQFSLDNSDNENSSRIQSRKSMVRGSMRKSIGLKESPLLEMSETTEDEGKNNSTANIIKDNEIVKGPDHTESPMNKTSNSEFVQDMDMCEAPSLTVLTAEATDRRVTRQVSALNSHETDHIIVTNDSTLGSEVDITCANTSLYSNLSDTNESHNFTLPRNTSSNRIAIDLGENVEIHSVQKPALSKRVSVQFSLDNSDNENSSRIQSRKSMVRGSMRKSIGLKESPLLEMSETTEDEGKSSSTENIMKGDEIVKGTDHTESPMNKTGKSEFGQDMDISVAPSLQGLIAEATDRCSPREPLLEMSETTEDEGKNNSTQTIIKDNEIVKGTDHTESPMNKTSDSEYVQDMDISEAPSPTVLTAQATDRRVTRQVSALNSHKADHIIVINDNTLGSEVDITCVNTSLTSNLPDTNESDNFTLPRNTSSNGKDIDLGENMEFHSAKNLAPSKRVSVQFSLDNSDNENSSRIQSRKSMVRGSMRKSIGLKESPLLEMSETTEDEGKSSSTENIMKGDEIVKGTDRTESPMNKTSNSEFGQDMVISVGPSPTVLTAEANDIHSPGEVSAVNSHETDHTIVTNENTLGSEFHITCDNSSLYSNLSDTTESHNFTVPRNTPSNGKAIDLGENVEIHSVQKPAPSKRVSVQFSLDNSNNENSSRIQSRKSMVRRSMRKSIVIKESPLLEISETTQDEGKSSSTENIIKDNEIGKGTDHTESPMNKTSNSEFVQDMDISEAPSLTVLTAEATDIRVTRQVSALNSYETDHIMFTNDNTLGSEVDITCANTSLYSNLSDTNESHNFTLPRNTSSNGKDIDLGENMEFHSAKNLAPSKRVSVQFSLDNSDNENSSRIQSRKSMVRGSMRKSIGLKESPLLEMSETTEDEGKSSSTENIIKDNEIGKGTDHTESPMNKTSKSEFVQHMDISEAPSLNVLTAEATDRRVTRQVSALNSHEANHIMFTNDNTLGSEVDITCANTSLYSNLSDTNESHNFTLPRNTSSNGKDIDLGDNIEFHSAKNPALSKRVSVQFSLDNSDNENSSRIQSRKSMVSGSMRKSIGLKESPLLEMSETTEDEGKSSSTENIMKGDEIVKGTDHTESPMNKTGKSEFGQDMDISVAPSLHGLIAEATDRCSPREPLLEMSETTEDEGKNNSTQTIIKDNEIVKGTDHTESPMNKISNSEYVQDMDISEAPSPTVLTAQATDRRVTRQVSALNSHEADHIIVTNDNTLGSEVDITCANTSLTSNFTDTNESDNFTLPRNTPSNGKAIDLGENVEIHSVQKPAPSKRVSVQFSLDNSDNENSSRIQSRKSMVRGSMRKSIGLKESPLLEMSETTEDEGKNNSTANIIKDNEIVKGPDHTESPMNKTSNSEFVQDMDMCEAPSLTVLTAEATDRRVTRQVSALNSHETDHIIVTNDSTLGSEVDITCANTSLYSNLSDTNESHNFTLPRNTSSNRIAIDLGENVEIHSVQKPAPSKRVSVEFSLDNSDNENSSRIQSRKSVVRGSMRKSIGLKESPLLEMSETTEDEGKSSSTENIMKGDEIVKGTDRTESPMNKTSNSEFGQDMVISVGPSPTVLTAEANDIHSPGEVSAVNSHETDHTIVTNENTLGSEFHITCDNSSLYSNLSDTTESHNFTVPRNTPSNGKAIDLGENVEIHSVQKPAPSKRVSVQFSLDNSNNENSSRIQSRKSMVRRSMRKSIVIKESPLLEISETTQDEGKSSSTENIIKDNEIGKGTDHTESPMNKTSNSEFVQDMDISEAPSLTVLTAEATDIRVTRQVSALNSYETDHIMFTNDNTLGSEVDITCANTSLYSNLSDTNESHNFTLPRNTSSNGKDIDLGENMEFHSAKNLAPSKRVSVQFSLDNSDNENSSRIQSRKSMVRGSMRKSIGLKESPLLEMSETTEDEGKSSSTENIMKGDEIVKGTDHTESPMNKTGKSEFGQDMDISVAPSLHGLIAEATDRCSPREPLLEMSETTEDEGKNNSTQTIIKDNEIVKGTDHTESPMNKTSNSEYVQDMDISEAPSPTVLTAQATDRRVTRQVSALNSHEADHIIVTNDNTLGSEVDITCANTSLTSNFTDTIESDNFTLPRNTPSNGKAIDLGENVEIHSVQKPALSKRVSVQFSVDNSDNENSSRIQSRKSMVRGSMRKSIGLKESPLLEMSETTEDEGKSSSTENIMKGDEIVKGTDHTESPMNKTGKSEFGQDMDISVAPSLQGLIAEAIYRCSPREPLLEMSETTEDEGKNNSTQTIIKDNEVVKGTDHTEFPMNKTSNFEYLQDMDISEAPSPTVSTAQATDTRATRQVSALNSHKADHIIVTNDNTLGSEVDITCANTSLTSNLPDTNESDNFTLTRNTSSNRIAIDLGENVEIHSVQKPALSKRVSVQFSLDNSDNENSSRIQSRKSMVRGSMRKSIGLKESPLLEMSETTEDEGKNNSTQTIIKDNEVVKGTDRTESPMNKTSNSEFGQDMDISVGPSPTVLTAEANDIHSPGEVSAVNSHETDHTIVTNENTLGSEFHITCDNSSLYSNLSDTTESHNFTVPRNTPSNGKAIDLGENVEIHSVQKPAPSKRVSVQFSLDNSNNENSSRIQSRKSMVRRSMRKSIVIKESPLLEISETTQDQGKSSSTENIIKDNEIGKGTDHTESPMNKTSNSEFVQDMDISEAPSLTVLTAEATDIRVTRQVSALNSYETDHIMFTNDNTLGSEVDITCANTSLYSNLSDTNESHNFTLPRNTSSNGIAIDLGENVEIHSVQKPALSKRVSVQFSVDNSDNENSSRIQSRKSMVRGSMRKSIGLKESPLLEMSETTEDEGKNNSTANIIKDNEIVKGPDHTESPMNKTSNSEFVQDMDMCEAPSLTVLTAEATDRRVTRQVSALNSHETDHIIVTNDSTLGSEVDITCANTSLHSNLSDTNESHNFTLPRNTSSNGIAIDLGENVEIHSVQKPALSKRVSVQFSLDNSDNENSSRIPSSKSIGRTSMRKSIVIKESPLSEMSETTKDDGKSSSTENIMKEDEIVKGTDHTESPMRKTNNTEFGQDMDISVAPSLQGLIAEVTERHSVKKVYPGNSHETDHTIVTNENTLGSEFDITCANTSLSSKLSDTNESHNFTLPKNTSSNRIAIDLGENVEIHSVQKPALSKRVSVQFSLDYSDNEDSSRIPSSKSMGLTSMRKSIVIKESPLSEMSETTQDEGKCSSTENIMKEDEIVKGTDHTESPMRKISNTEFGQDMDISVGSSLPALAGEVTERHSVKKVYPRNSHETDHTIVTNENTLGSEFDITCANTSLSSKLSDTNESHNFTLPKNTSSNRKAIDLGGNIEIHSAKNLAPSKRVSVQFSLDYSDNEDSSRIPSSKSMVLTSMRKSIVIKESPLSEMSETTQDEGKCSSTENIMKEDEIVKGTDHTESPMRKISNTEFGQDIDISVGSSLPALAGEVTERHSVKKVYPRNSHETDHTIVTNENTLGSEFDITCANTSLSSKLSDTNESHNFTLPKNTSLNTNCENIVESDEIVKCTDITKHSMRKSSVHNSVEMEQTSGVNVLTIQSEVDIICANTSISSDLSDKGGSPNFGLQSNSTMDKEDLGSVTNVVDSNLNNGNAGRKVSVQFSLDDSDINDSSVLQTRKSMGQRSVRKSVGMKESPLTEISKINEDEEKNSRSKNEMEHSEIVKGTDLTESPVCTWTKNDKTNFGGEVDISGAPSPAMLTGGVCDRHSMRKSSVHNSIEMEHSTGANLITIQSGVDITSVNSSISSNVPDRNGHHKFTLQTSSTGTDFVCDKYSSNCLKETSIVTVVPASAESLDILGTASPRGDKFVQKMASKHVSVHFGFDNTTYSSKLENTTTDFVVWDKYSSNSFKETPSTILHPAISDTIVLKEQKITSKHVSVEIGFDSTTSSKLENSKTDDNCSSNGFKETTPFDSELTSLQPETLDGLMLIEPKDESSSKEGTSIHNSTHHSVLASSLTGDVSIEYPRNCLTETLLSDTISKKLPLIPSKIIMDSSAADSELDSKVGKDLEILQRQPHLGMGDSSLSSELNTEKTMAIECSVTEKCPVGLSTALTEKALMESSDCPTNDLLLPKSIYEESDSPHISSNIKFENNQYSITTDKSSESSNNYGTNTENSDKNIGETNAPVETKDSANTRKPYVRSTRKLNVNIDGQKNVSPTKCVNVLSSKLSKMNSVGKTVTVEPERNLSPLSFTLSIGSLSGESSGNEENYKQFNSEVKESLVVINSEYLGQEENCDENSVSLDEEVLAEKKLTYELEAKNVRNNELSFSCPEKEMLNKSRNVVKSHGSSSCSNALLISNANNETLNKLQESMNSNLQKEEALKINDDTPEFLPDETSNTVVQINGETSNSTLAKLSLRENNKIFTRGFIKNIETEENKNSTSNNIASEKPLKENDKNSPLVADSIVKESNKIKSTSLIENQKSLLADERNNESPKAFQSGNNCESLISQVHLNFLHNSESNTTCKDNVIVEENTNLSQMHFLIKSRSAEESFHFRPSYPREYLSTSCDPILPTNLSFNNILNEDNSCLLGSESVPNQTLPNTSRCDIVVSNNSIFDVSLPKGSNFENESIKTLSSKCSSDVIDLPVTKHTSNDKSKSINSEISEESKETKGILSNLRRSTRRKKSSLIKTNFEEQKKEKRKSVTFATVTVEKNISPHITDIDSSTKKLMKNNNASSTTPDNAYLKIKEKGKHSVEENMSSMQEVFICPKEPLLENINSNHESHCKKRIHEESESPLSLESKNRSKRKKSSDKSINDLSRDTIDVSEIPRDKIIAPKRIIYHSTPINPVPEMRKKLKISSRSNIMNSNSRSITDKKIQVSNSIFGSFSKMKNSKSSELSTSYSHGGESSSQAKRKTNDTTATQSKRLKVMQDLPFKLSSQSTNYSKSKMHSTFSNHFETASVQSFISPGTLTVSKSPVSKYSVKFRQKVQFKDFSSKADSSTEVQSYNSMPTNDNSDSMFSPPTSDFSRYDCSKQVNFRDHLSFIRKSSSTIKSPSHNEISVSTVYSEAQPSEEIRQQKTNTTNNSSLSYTSLRFKRHNSQLSLHKLHKKNNHNQHLSNNFEASFANSEGQDLTLSSIGKQTKISEMATLSDECFDILAERIRNTSNEKLDLDLPSSMKKRLKINTCESGPRFFTDGKPYSYRKVKFPSKWVSFELYEYCHGKLKPCYGQEAPAMTERLVAHICSTVSAVDNLNETSDIELATLVIRHLLFKYKICTNVLEYCTLICKYTPHDFQRKVLPINGYFNSLPIKNMKKLSDPFTNEIENLNVSLC